MTIVVAVLGAQDRHSGDGWGEGTVEGAGVDDCQEILQLTQFHQSPPCITTAPVAARHVTRMPSRSSRALMAVAVRLWVM